MPKKRKFFFQLLFLFSSARKMYAEKHFSGASFTKNSKKETEQVTPALFVYIWIL